VNPRASGGTTIAMGKRFLAALAAVATSVLVLGVASVVATMLMIALNGFSEARVMPFAIAYLVAVAVANTACASVVARTVLGERGGGAFPWAIGASCTLLPCAVIAIAWVRSLLA
jgi:hypothetical protein